MTMQQSKTSKIVVADSTPLIVLGNCGYLYLLKELFNEIYIPMAVFSEVTAKMDLSAKELVNGDDWVKVCILQNDIQSFKFHHKLDLGEKEALAVAISQKADLIIIDDGKARKEAEIQNIQYTGTAGILLLAKRLNLIAEVKPILDNVCKNGLYMSKETYNYILNLANE